MTTTMTSQTTGEIPFGTRVRIVAPGHWAHGLLGTRAGDDYFDPHTGQQLPEGTKRLIVILDKEQIPSAYHPYFSVAPEQVRRAADLPSYAALYDAILATAHSVCRRMFFGEPIYSEAIPPEVTHRPMTCMGLRDWALADQRPEVYTKTYWDRIRAKGDYCPVCQAADLLGLRTFHPWKD